MAITVTTWLQTNTWTLTVGGTPTAADTFTVSTATASQVETGNDSPGAHQFTTGSTTTVAATSIAALINTDFSGVLTATSSGAVVTIAGPMTAYSVGTNTGTYSLAAVALPSQPVAVNVSVTTSGGVMLSVVAAGMAATPQGLNYRATSVNLGSFALAPGQNVTVPANASALVLPSALTAYAQLDGTTNLYSISTQIETSDGSFTNAPAVTLSVTGAVVG